MGQNLSFCWIALLFSFLFSTPVYAGPNLIAYIGGEGALYTIQPDGNGKRKLAFGELLHTTAPLGERVGLPASWTSLMARGNDAAGGGVPLDATRPLVGVMYPTK